MAFRFLSMDGCQAVKDDYPVDPNVRMFIRNLFEGAHSDAMKRLILPNGHTICPYCKCHLIYDSSLDGMRHKVPKKGEACLFLRNLVGGARP